jgi:hypothetical protein
MIKHTTANAALAALLLLACAAAPAFAVSLDELSTSDTSSGLKAALGESVEKAVGQLGVKDGFLSNPKVTIPLPKALEKADNVMRRLGMGGKADDLKVAMNHAAESAVTEATPVLKAALKKMTLEDAKSILTGGDDAATSYFRRTSGDELMTKFKPVVMRATAKVKLAKLYNQYAGKASDLGLLDAKDANMDDYVTAKTLDGLFTIMADEEKAIRKDPLGQASSLIRKVFSAH